MAIFEVLVGVSISLALGIPTFFEKVMRPRYEDIFALFRRIRRNEFMEQFEKALAELRNVEELSEDSINMMEELFKEWSKYQSEENELDYLLNMRKIYFMGWAITTLLSIFSIDYSNLIIGSSNLTIGLLCIISFLILFTYTVYYGYRMFSLDEKLKKVKSGSIDMSSSTSNVSFSTTSTTTTTSPSTTYVTTTTTQPPFSQDNINTMTQYEAKISYILKNNDIPFIKEAKMQLQKKTLYFDFIIPDIDKPKYLIEIKSKVSGVIMRELLPLIKEIKSKYNLKTILISDFKNIDSQVKERVLYYWDEIIDFNELDKLTEIIKLE